VIVIVLETWGWDGGVLEYCAKSQLHPPRRIGGAEEATESVGLPRVELDTLCLDSNSRLSIALSASPIRRGGCNSGNALLLGLTRLFCKQQRSSTSTNAKRERPFRARPPGRFPPDLKAWAVLLGHFMATAG
jgi:hypothetical protein